MSVAIDSSNNIHVTAIKIKNLGDEIISTNNNADKETIPAPDGSGSISQSQTTTTNIPATTFEQRKSTCVDTVLDDGWNKASVHDVAEADLEYWTIKRDGAVKLHRKAGDTFKAQTVPEFFEKTVEEIPDNVAMAVKRGGHWIKWTYKEYLRDVRIAAKGFIKLGLEPYHGVGIIGFNSPEWFLADLGCIYACGLVSGIYATNNPEACQFVAENCRANVIVVENDQQLHKILQVKSQLPYLKALVQYTGNITVPNREGFIYTWPEFMDLGKQVPDSQLEERIKMLSPNKCCVLIYTSGTTGNPKGVMLSHDNIVFTASMTHNQVSQQVELEYGELSMVSYLPLSHIAAQMLDIFVITAFGGTIYFAQPDALKGSLNATLKEVRPHVFLGVPRVWEKMQEGMINAARSAPSIKRSISRWAKSVGYKSNHSLMEGGSRAFGYTIANKLVFQKVKGLLGLDRCVIRISGAAPIMKETLEFFLSLDMPICEVYGMSESTGPHSTALPNMNKVGSVGKELHGIYTKIDNPDADGNGEILMNGRHVFMGYLDEEEKTREVIDERGHLHTGDIGRKDKDGFLYITGRIKELIITAGGENIPPVKIEDMVKEALPCISQCMLIGDKKKFLSMLLTMKVDVNPDTLEPTDRLTIAAQEWVRSVGSSAYTVTQILEPGDTNVLQAIQQGINKVNAQAISNAQKIQKWSLLAKDFSLPGGELGPTMKLRRPIILKMYADTIDALYNDEAAV